MEIENQGTIEKTTYLNEKDIIWRNLRYQPFFEHMKKLSLNYQEFVKTHANEQGEKTENMVKVLRSLPQYQDILEDYSKHLNNMIKIAKIFKETN